MKSKTFKAFQPNQEFISGLKCLQRPPYFSLFYVINKEEVKLNILRNNNKTNNYKKCSLYLYLIL